MSTNTNTTDTHAGCFAAKVRRAALEVLAGIPGDATMPEDELFDSIREKIGVDFAVNAAIDKLLVELVEQESITAWCNPFDGVQFAINPRGKKALEEMPTEAPSTPARFHSFDERWRRLEWSRVRAWTHREGKRAANLNYHENVKSWQKLFYSRVAKLHRPVRVRVIYRACSFAPAFAAGLVTGILAATIICAFSF